MNKTTIKLTTLSLTTALSIAMLSGCTSSESGKTSKESPSPKVVNELYKRPEKIDYNMAEQLLKEGNQRFQSNKILSDDISTSKRKDLVSNGQHPFAVVLTCSDSRVPPETLFDQGLGDIFVIRDAGNVIDPVELGSIEYGVEHLGSPLIVVLGHDNCGAVKAAVEGGEAEGNIKDIVEKIKPSLEKAKHTCTGNDKLCEACENENIKNSVAQIKNDPIIKKLEKENKVKVVGAKYHLDTGVVSFQG
ncbi:carbonic anhydrase [Pseudobacteroides cellulosolvens]|uniref:carbonic anhydrase n=1 Tax=Pseudobacteroides cellulosolvens ATCC 35603 = DSM 2933 TaxID=398512 RepID=A0A0L6JLA7_9FIRM|nr:carbonic anhydrase [Pseudobacteroides cellulosolvens]KNY26530.1 carbonic anhydrase [Pseudobacteroides cellulosolvens ATCC 35603 = DSM 2933]